eukprot:767717-Hanusia_phi.AAC.4
MESPPLPGTPAASLRGSITSPARKAPSRVEPWCRPQAEVGYKHPRRALVYRCHTAEGAPVSSASTRSDTSLSVHHERVQHLARRGGVREGRVRTIYMDSSNGKTREAPTTLSVQNHSGME